MHLPPTGTYPLSVEAWVRLDAAPAGEAVVVDRPLVAGQTGAFRLSVDKACRLKASWRNYQKGAPAMQTATDPGAVPVGRWVHVAFVYQWGNTFVVYVDGQLKGKRSFFSWHIHPTPGLVPDKQPGVLWIGNDPTLACPLPGAVDEVRIATDVFEFFPLPDFAWPDAKAQRRLVLDPAYTPARDDVLLYASFDKTLDADIAAGSAKASDTKQAKPTPGVRGRGVAGGVRFQSKGNLDLREGALEFWFQPVGWDNIHYYHQGVAGGPFMIYVFNSGHVSPGGHVAGGLVEGRVVDVV